MRINPLDRYRRWAKRVKSHALYNYLPGVIDWAVKTSTAGARKAIGKAGGCRILTDNTVLGHGVTHETGWIDTGVKLWGGRIPIETGLSARIPVHSETDDSDAARSVRYLPAIASLAKQGAISLFTSPELQDEQWSQPGGRFLGYGYYDFSLFSRIALETLPDPEYTTRFGFGCPSAAEQREARFAAKSDPLFRSLVKVLGQSNSQDAWHIATAQNHGCFCFLTMDFKLLRTLHAQRNNPVVASLLTRVMTPEQFGQVFKLLPVSPRLYSYHDASFPVYTEFNWPDSQRRKHRRKSKQ